MRLFILLLLLIYSKSIFALSIDDSVKSTIANNLKVKIAFEKLNESKETIEVAIGKKLPTVTGTISGTYSNSDTTSAAGVSTTPETFTDKYKISITQNLYDGGEKSLEIERSKFIYENSVIVADPNSYFNFTSSKNLETESKFFSEASNDFS